MGGKRFEASTIKNKVKREEVARKHKKAKRQEKLQKRLQRAKVEATNPAVRKKRLAENVPRTLDNMREFDPSMLTANPNAPPEPTASTSNLDRQPSPTPSSSSSTAPEKQPGTPPQPEEDDLVNQFSSYFNFDTSFDPSAPPKVLITTSNKASKFTYEFCDDLANVVPGAEFIRRKKGKGFEMGRIAGWAGDRGYSNMIVVNEDMKKPNAVTMIHLPHGPSAYFRLTSVQLMKQIANHARPTTHYPELVLNGFVTRLGNAVGQMFQTLFPAIPEFQGRQVVALHNQRDFLFFRRFRYAFRSTEKAALQEIGPRFTLKLRWLKKDIPAVRRLGAPAKPLLFADDMEEGEDVPESSNNEPADKSDEGDDAEGVQERGDGDDADVEMANSKSEKIVPPAEDEYLWIWKPELETTRKTFFL